MKTDLFQMVILAGGLATRLHPVTHTIPKSLIEVNEELFIVHQLRLLQQNGIREIVICVGFLGELIVDKIGDGKQYGVNIVYSFDGPTLLGTAGAIKHALPLLNESFFILYGDSYLPCHYRQIQNAFLENDKNALMTVFENKGQWDASNVEFRNNTIQAYDKKNKTERMHYIDYGLGVFQKSAFEQLPCNVPCDLSDLYQSLLVKKQLIAYEVKERFYEGGSFAGLQELEYYLSSGRKTHAIY